MSDPMPATGGGRTYLFVPGSRPERFDKAVASGADHVILDLEDAVPPEHKSEALVAAAAWLVEHRAFVRVNEAGTEWHTAELRTLAALEGVLGLVVPKASAESVQAVAATLDGRGPVLPLVESARGIASVGTIAAHPAVARLMFGSLDLALDLGIDDLSGDEPGLLTARSSLVLASAVNGLPGPADGVFPDIGDPEGLARATRRARSLGFTGKLCIHPRQVDIVHETLRPSAADIAWAKRVIGIEARTGGKAVMEAGEMLDVPQYRRAARILARTADGADPAGVDPG